ncbi:MAG: class I SAM-dependent methyltransferase [Mycobacteriaceae bacterium]|nr:class I SAM-dependent methyltransferase [Mycobacteriaceae bacterium]
MTRTSNVRQEGDTWDLASSVGATATMVATARALASQQANPIINDPFAAPLVRAVGLDFFTQLVDGRIDAATTYDNSATDLQLETDSIAVRTRFFDEFFRNAAEDGIRQSVILAAGLDARAYRLTWPAAAVVYEVDQPKVIEFKNATMATLGAEPLATRRVVSVDLRDDWPTALRNNGFDPSQPTSWSAEGLLMYLPAEAQDRLFDNLTSLSAPGSQLATEYHPESGPTLVERAQAINQRWADFGCDIDFGRLFYTDERNNVADYLINLGWQVRTQERPELATSYGLTFPDDDPMAPFRKITAVTATLR